MPHAETVDRFPAARPFTSYGMFPPASTAMRAFNYSMIAAYEFACLSPDSRGLSAGEDSTAGSEGLAWDAVRLRPRDQPDAAAGR